MRAIGMTSLCLSMIASALPAQAEYFHPIFNPATGGSICYYRNYSAAFLKANPNVKLTSIQVERTSIASQPNSKNNFVINFNAATKAESYSSYAYCKPNNGVVSCNIEADGGTFTLHRAGRGLIIKTRRIEIEGIYKDLAITSQTGKPTRSFTLRGSRWETCEALFD